MQDRRFLMGIAAGFVLVVVAVAVVVMVTSSGSDSDKRAEAERFVDVAPTAVPSPAPSLTPVPTATAVPPTQTPEPAPEPAAPAPTARPAAQPPAAAPPPPPPPTVGPTAEEMRYRNQALAQLSYLTSQLRQNNAQALSYQTVGNFYAKMGATAENFISALNGLEPVPDRYRAVHDELLNSHIALRDVARRALNIRTAQEFTFWLADWRVVADRANAAIAAFNRVVGTAL